MWTWGSCEGKGEGGGRGKENLIEKKSGGWKRGSIRENGIERGQGGEREN